MTRPAADSADRLPEVDNRVISPGAFDPGVRAVLAALHQEVRRVSWIATRTPNGVTEDRSRRRNGSQSGAGIVISVPVREQHAVRKIARRFRCATPTVTARLAVNAAWAVVRARG